MNLTRSGHPVNLREHLLISLFLFVVVLAAFSPLLEAGFINYDDPLFVSQNVTVSAGLSWSNIGWAWMAGFFRHSSLVEYWEPVVAWSRLTDFSLYGFDAKGHHLTSVLIHGANAVLLYAGVFSLSASRVRSGLVAILFALHPLNVEAVGWLSARKDLLGGTGTLLTVLAYIHYAKRPAVGRYLGLLLAYGFAAMTKPSVMVVPALLMVIDHWPLRREVGWRSLLVEKIPLFALAGVVAFLAWLSQHGFGAFLTLESIPPLHRLANAVINSWIYFRQWVYPSSLSIIYPISRLLNLGELIWAGCFFVGTSTAAICWRKRYPSLLTGWLWFLVGLAPVIGLVALGSSRTSDRYMYVPMMGLIAAVVFLPWEAWSGTVSSSRVLCKSTGALVCGLLIGTLGLCSYAQSKLWRSSVDIFSHAARLYPDFMPVNLQLALGLADEARYKEAVGVGVRALQISPENGKLWRVLGRSLAKMGQLPEASRVLDRAIRFEPTLALAYLDRGELLGEQGKMELAFADMEKALELVPNGQECFRRRAQLLAKAGRWPEALADGEQMLALWPHNGEYVFALAQLWHQSGDDAEALEHLKAGARAVDANPEAAIKTRVLLDEILERRRR